MGRQPWSDRLTVEECRDVSVSWLNLHDYFCGFKSGGIEWKNATGKVTCSIGIQVSVDEEFHGGKWVKFHSVYKDLSSGESERVDYRVDLVTTPCTFGGVRYWFICPLMVNDRPCRRRVGTLYLPPDARYFGCRHCYNLTYRSRKQHDKKMSFYRKLGYKDVMRGMKGGDMRALREMWRRIEGRRGRQK